MKPKIVLPVIFSLTLIGVVSAVVLSSSQKSTDHRESTRRFQVQGVVRHVDVANKVVRIAHEAIPNYMPAMTMPLPVRDIGLLKNVAAGDNVQFELSVTADDSWISHMDKIATDAAVMEPTPGATASLEEREAECIHAGESIPDFELQDQDGKKFHLHDFHGKAVVLTFIYTRCPLPNFCPLMSKNFAELQQRLGKEFPNKYQLLSISIDPEFDRPEVLKGYSTRYQADTRDWTFATGDPASINFIAGLFGLYFRKEGGLISHDLRTGLIGPDGRMVHLWKSNVWTPYEVHRMIQESGVK